MAEITYMAFHCLNPECKKQIKIKRPEKSGVYSITCPHCGTKKLLRLKGNDDVKQSGEYLTKIEDQSTPQIPDNSTKDTIELKEDFIAGETYTIKCPHCEKQEIGFSTDKPGHRAIPCPYCKGKIGLDVRKKTEVIVITEQIQHIKGKLILLRKGWLNKDYHLSIGRNVIGRYDESAMSDISIKNDSSISRRSIEIEVKETEKGYSFKLKVLKATNPVFHNNSPLTNGDSVSLNFGDCIILGKTKFRFDKDV